MADESMRMFSRDWVFCENTECKRKLLKENTKIVNGQRLCPVCAERLSKDLRLKRIKPHLEGGKQKTLGGEDNVKN